MQTTDRLQYLLEKMEKHAASEDECQELLQLIDADENGVVIERIDAFHAARPSVDPQPDLGSSYWKNGIQEVLQSFKTRENTIPEAAPVGRVRLLRRISWAAAAAAVVLTAGAYYFLTINRKAQKTVQPAEIVQKTILPGKNGALLTLADGSQVVLDSVGDGIIAQQQGANAVLKNGQLSYAPGTSNSAEISYNILSTPKGRQFRMQLPDGTKVWLNAGSSIRYPTAFRGRDRNVAITGEAYFEVVHNAASPFIVNANNRIAVEVLGTSFNVNAYDNESNINTTLLEGTVKVSVPPAATIAAKAPTVILKPGQQARISNSGYSNAEGITVLTDIDTDKIIAWKNGYFNFGKANIQEVMRQLERWYDIEVVYETGIPDIQFVGKMTRNINLQDLFQILESTGVNFRIEGKKVIVTK